jgi:hypothetical protein
LGLRSEAEVLPALARLGPPSSPQPPEDIFARRMADTLLIAIRTPPYLLFFYYI